MKNIFSPITEFIPLGAQEKNLFPIIITWGNVDITENVHVISLDPIILGIWMSGVHKPKKNDIITIKTSGKVVAELQGELLRDIRFNDSKISLWRVIRSNFLSMKLIEKHWELPQIIRQSKNSNFNLNSNSIRIISSIYFKPRKVFLVVIKCLDHLNMFPMDLHLRCPMSKNYFFALQDTNSSTKYLKKEMKVLVCEVKYSDLNLIYKLGKNHKEAKKELISDELKGSRLSPNFNFPIPSFCKNYAEVEIKEYHKPGTHNLFLGKVIHEDYRDLKIQNLYHIHRFSLKNIRDNKMLMSSIQLNV